MSRVNLETKTTQFSRERIVCLLADATSLDALIKRLQWLRDDEARFAAQATVPWTLVDTQLYPEYDSGHRDSSRDEDPTSTLTVTFMYERPATAEELAEAQTRADASEKAHREGRIKSLRFQLRIAESSITAAEELRQQLRDLGEDV